MKQSLTTVFLFLIFINLCSRTRTPAVSGQWYPADPAKLNSMLDGFFQKVEIEDKNDLDPMGLIAPHAGFVYSGQVAAYGYSLLEGKEYDTVIIIGTSHHYLDDVVSVYNGDFYETPLGKVPIDKKMADEFLKFDEKITFKELIHAPEHSLEAQVPFLQSKLSEFKILPILTSTHDFSLLDKLADHLSDFIQNSEKRILVVCSTDMSHFHDYDSAVKMDKKTVNLITEQKWELLKKKILAGDCELCGFYALYSFIGIMRNLGCEKNYLLKYANSGDAMNDPNSNRVVGYCSIVFPQKEKEGSMLSISEKKYLLDLARKSIEYRLEHGTSYKPEKPDGEILNQELAVFVTLNKFDNLRGCIGQLIAGEPLYLAVSHMAESSAFNDHRFNRVSEKELDDVKIEISVLSPQQKIENIDEIRMGIDGVWIKKGFQSGVFLPQVAMETGWDKKTFLENLCSHKAGLAKDAYLDKDTEIYIFQVEKFREE